MSVAAVKATVNYIIVSKLRKILDELSNNDTSEEARCRYKSEVWWFFVKIREKSVKCNLFNKMLANYGETSSMLQHLDKIIQHKRWKGLVDISKQAQMSSRESWYAQV